MGEDAFVIRFGQVKEFDECTGESVLVYPTRQTAKEALETHAARVGRVPVGVVLTICGKQLYASDPREPLGWLPAGRSGANSNYIPGGNAGPK